MKLRCQLVRAGVNSPQEENFFRFIFLTCQFSGPWSSGSLAAVRQVRTLLYQIYLSSRSSAVSRCSRSQTEGVAAFFFMFYQPFPDSCSLLIVYEYQLKQRSASRDELKAPSLYTELTCNTHPVSNFSLFPRLLISHFGSCYYFFLLSSFPQWMSLSLNS